MPCLWVQIGQPTLLFDTLLVGWEPFDVHPDGERFVTIQHDPDELPNRLHVVFNWFEELKRLVPTD